jgi:RimJ/RimL family protein N-acetyltransferase
MSHNNFVTPERAFSQSMDIIYPVWKEKMHNQELRYRMDSTNTYIIKAFNPTYLREKRVGSWKLLPFPGCCGVCISTEALVYPEFRNKGWGKLFNKMRISQAQAMGYGKIVCTVTSDNLYEIAILNRNGWVRETDFINPKTNHMVITFGFNL